MARRSARKGIPAVSERSIPCRGDMVRAILGGWSMTLHGGKEEGFDFMYDDEPIFNLDDLHSPCQSGMCE